jgi:hypothetical protein
MAIKYAFFLYNILIVIVLQYVDLLVAAIDGELFVDLLTLDAFYFTGKKTYRYLFFVVVVGICDRHSVND